MEATICFGNKTVKSVDTNVNTTGTSNSTSAGTSMGASTNTTGGPQWLSDAAQGNLDFATNLQNQGFTPYGGNQVAQFSPQQWGSFGLGNEVAGGVAPYVGETGGLVSNFANAGPSRVNNTPISANMSPYMNQYVRQALAPQLNMQDQQFAAQNKGFDAQATGAGAFGDTGWGLGRSNLTQQQDTARTGLIGNAYNAAFNTAIGAGAQDSASNLNAQTTNANLRESALGRQLAGANALYGMGTGATNLTNTLGGQQTAQGQADLNAKYNQWLMAQQYPFQTAGLVNSTLGTARNAAPITSTGQTMGATTGETAGTTTGTKVGNETTKAPDNSGFQLLGTLGGAALGSFVGMPGVGASIGGGVGNWWGNSGTSAGNAGGTGGGMGGYYAEGGRPPVGQPAVVGEKGPEAFVPDRGRPAVVGARGPESLVPAVAGSVIPNAVLRAAMAKRDRERLAQAPGLARSLGLAA